MKLHSLTIAAACLAALPTSALPQSSAANYPSKPVHIIVSVAPGGPTDLFARMFSSYFEKKYKQPAIVENKPGAGSLLAADYVAKSAPDGYTLLAAGNILAFESLLNKDTAVNSAKDILPFGIFAGSGLFTCVHPSIPARTMAEFVSWVKANPGKLNVGTAGAPVAAWEGLRDRLGLNWVVVNYKGGAAAFTALLSGEVHMYTCDVNQGLQPMKDGKVRLLGYSERQRHAAIPDVPTMAESGIGVPDFFFQVWLGMFGPAAMPEEIAIRLNADVNDMSASSDSLMRYNAMGWRPIPLGVAAIRKDTQALTDEVAGLLAKGVKLR